MAKKSIYDVFGTNKEAETQGIWINYGKEIGKFLVARSGGANTRFATVLEAKMRPHRRQVDQKTIEADVAEAILVESFVEAVLIDWDGIKDRSGKKISFSKAAALKLFKDLPDLYSDLREQSTMISNFQDEQDQVDAGN